MFFVGLEQYYDVTDITLLRDRKSWFLTGRNNDEQPLSKTKLYTAKFSVDKNSPAFYFLSSVLPEANSKSVKLAYGGSGWLSANTAQLFGNLRNGAGKEMSFAMDIPKETLIVNGKPITSVEELKKMMSEVPPQKQAKKAVQ